MAGHGLQRAFLLIAAFVWIAACDDNDGLSCNTTEIREASIGKEFTLHCSRGCPNSPYRWFNHTGQLTLLSQETSAVLTVSEKVDSATAVGGQRYVCQCGETGPTKCYNIWVTPYVKFNVSKEVAKLGSNVTFTCSAESYPPTNKTDFFHLQHPATQDIPHEYLTPVDTHTGVEYSVVNANYSDGGEYDCIVIVDTAGGHVQNESRINLTVYDPPVIIKTRSSAVVLCGEESTVLECVVENREKDLKVWVKWTTGSGFDPLMEGNYTMGRTDGGVHFLMLHGVTQDKVPLYTCELYSAYSNYTPEDLQSVNTTVEDLQKCTKTLGLQTQENCDCSTKIIAICVSFVVVVIVIIIISVVVCWKCCEWKSGHRVSPQGSPQTRDEMSQVNPAYGVQPIHGNGDKSVTPKPEDGTQ